MQRVTSSAPFELRSALSFAAGRCLICFSREGSAFFCHAETQSCHLSEFCEYCKSNGPQVAEDCNDAWSLCVNSVRPWTGSGGTNLVTRREGPAGWAEWLVLEGGVLSQGAETAGQGQTWRRRPPHSERKAPHLASQAQCCWFSSKIPCPDCAAP